MPDLVNTLLSELKKVNIRFYSAYAVLLAGFCAEWVLFKTQVGICYPNIIGTFLKCIGDCAPFLVLLWIVPRKWRWVSLLPLWIFGLWAMANIAYFRFWHDLIPATAPSMGDNINGSLLGYGISLLKPVDSLYLLIPAAATAIYLSLRPGKEIIRLKVKLFAVAASVAMLFPGQFSYLKSQAGWVMGQYGVGFTDMICLHYSSGSFPLSLYQTAGMPVYAIVTTIDAIKLSSASVNLSEEERHEISDFLAHYDRSGNAGETINDSTNIVYMIVESLNAEVLGKEVNGLRIAPTLDSLASLPGTVTFDNVICQIDKSGSSDGHLLLLTGLMPPEQVSYCFKFGSTNRFHSLQDAFPRHTKKAMLATTGTFWNEAKVLANFGTGPVSTIKDLDGDVEEIGRDGVLIQNAIEEMRNLPRPFFLTLMTISMHIPFEEEAWPLLPQLAESDSLNRFERNYYNVTHYFDRYLKQLVDNLPPNTVLFIASDHSQDISRGTDESTRPAVFLAAGCGRSGRISRPVGQVNLYPATLELLGASFDGYGGVAMSALNPAVRGTLDTKGARRGFMTEAEMDTLKEAKRISDLIIRSNYFKDEQY